MNDAAIVFTPVDIQDVEQLHRLAVKAYKDHYVHLWHDSCEWYMQKCFSTNQLAEEIQDANAKFFIVQINNRAVGYIKINLDAPLAEEPKALELERVYFVADASGKGIGSKAMEFVFTLAESFEKKIVWLKVMDSSIAAIAFYNKLGFSICGTHRLNYTEMKPELRGMFIMKKYLR
ncbi:MAG TPA: GNAT family N-acetyltransferase [Chitinophagaceae bacterium]|nr:GNAT family N-acetyltransferase [Chitinophagaceae bacterium]